MHLRQCEPYIGDLEIKKDYRRIDKGTRQVIQKHSPYPTKARGRIEARASEIHLSNRRCSHAARTLLAYEQIIYPA